MDTLSIEIGKRIRERRKSLNIKQQSLKEYMGTASNQMISNWEKGHTTPSPFYLIKLAQVLDTSIDYLLTGIENKKSKLTISSEHDLLFYFSKLLLDKSFVDANYDIKSNSLCIYIRDLTIYNFYSDYKKLLIARSVIGEELFVSEVNKLINKYNSIDKK